MAKLHPIKAIREAIESAIENGFTLHPVGRSSHNHSELYCPESSRSGCIIRVLSTPRSPEGHAKFIRSRVADCLTIHPRP